MGQGIGIPLFGLVLCLALAVYYIPDRPQSFTVQAATEVLTVEVAAEGQTVWDVELLQLCLPGRPEITKAPDAGQTLPECAESYYGRRTLSEVEISWPAGYRLTFRILGMDAIEVLVEQHESSALATVGDLALTSGTLLRIPYSMNGATLVRPLVPVRGYVRIGSVPNQSDTLLLHTGRYEIRQKMWWRRLPIVVARGELFTGDRIGFVCQRAPIWVAQEGPQVCASPQDVIAHLFVTDISPRIASLDVVATTDQTYSALQMTRIGGQPTEIYVPWTQRVVNDPLPVAVATILGLIATSLALAKSLNPRKEKEKP